MLLKSENITYSYPGSAPALSNMCLNVEQGDFLGIMGETGCGKSTFIKLLCGLLKPDSGQVLLNGEDINAPRYDRRILRRSIGLVFQFPEYQLFETTVERDVVFSLKGHDMSRQEKSAAARAALEMMGFEYEAVKDKSPLGFSGGEKRRIAIAGVLAARPDILMLDEPVAGLDPLGREAFIALLKKLNDSGTTIVMVSHNSDAVASCCRRLVLMKDGHSIADDSTEAVFSRSDILEKASVKPPQLAQLKAMLRARGIDTGTALDYSALVERLKEQVSHE